MCRDLLGSEVSPQVERVGHEQAEDLLWDGLEVRALARVCARWRPSRAPPENWVLIS